MKKTSGAQKMKSMKKMGEKLRTGSTVLNDKYQLLQLLGKGSFGEVYRGIFLIKETSNEIKYPDFTAVKIQINNQLEEVSQISTQIEVLKTIHKGKTNPKGFPLLYASGVENGYSFMVIDLFGPNLLDLMTLCGGKFSLNTTVALIIQIIENVRVLHQNNFVYRDIKPQNFVLGLGYNSRRVHMIDYGLCKRYRDPKTSLLHPYRQNLSIAGTIRYSSISSHLGIDQTRRDDLQSICYLMVYMVKGELPWQHLRTENKIEKDNMILSSKLKISEEDLCQELPMELLNVVEYVKNLDFYEDPDYEYIMRQLREAINPVQDGNYDWDILSKSSHYEKQYLQIVYDYSGSIEEKSKEDQSYQSRISSRSSNSSSQNKGNQNQERHRKPSLFLQNYMNEKKQI